MTRVWDYRAEYERDREAILAAVDRVFSSGRLVLGESVAGFEKEFAAWLGADHCVGVDNGTNAVELALRAAGVQPGDEVITVSNTAAPTVVAIDALGATPVLVDIDPRTYLMDVDQVASAITPRTTCVLPVHLYGQCADLSRLEELCGRHGLAMVEDCAQSHGARHHGRVSGTVGRTGAFSFYPTKVLGAYGDGGAVVTSSTDVAAQVRRLRYYGMSERYYVEQLPGHNARLDEVQAEILRWKLARLDEDVAARRAVAERYRTGLAGTALALPEVAEGNDHVYYLYVVRSHERDRVLAEMAARGVHLTVSYRWPVHTMSGFADLGYAVGDLPVTEEAATQIFSLPMYSTLGAAEQDIVIEHLREVVGT